jgi:hypothetical protein
LGSAGEAAMSEPKFQRELSPEQIREALSLLDGMAGAQNQNLRIGDLRPAEEVEPEPDDSSTTTATQDWSPAAEDPLQRKKHLNSAVALLGIGIAAAGALALSSWRERVPPPPVLGIVHEQSPTQSAAPAAKSDSSALPVAKPPPDQSPGGLERQSSTPGLAGLSRDVTVRVDAAKKRFLRLHWQARADDDWCIVACRRAGGDWCFFACRTWRAQPVFYQPRRNVTQ